MADNKNLITKSLEKPIKDFLSDLSELGIDEAIDKISQESELMKQIPIIKWLLIGNEIRSNIQTAFFLKKYSQFIGRISQENLSEEDSEKLLAIFSDNKKLKRLIDSTIIALDRYQNELKAQLLGELFIQTFKYYNFSVKEYNSLMYSIELMHPYSGIEDLTEFYEYKQKLDSAADDKEKRNIWAEGSNIDYSPLSTSGLLMLPKGDSSAGNLGGAFLNDLGYRFYKCVVSKCSIENSNA